MSAIVTQELVLDYLERNPYSTPIDIAKNLDVPLYGVKARIIRLYSRGDIDRREVRPKLDSMFYFKVKK
jgi:predicted transcriptional regulator